MTLPISLMLPGATLPLKLTAGMSTIVVGANGAGKTKLAIECERQLGETAHRIAAQRMLALDPAVQKISEQVARGELRYGHHQPDAYGNAQHTREVRRWGNNRPDFILDDAGALLQVLFGEQANTAVAALNAHADGAVMVSTETLMRRLKEVFQRVLPTRRLDITADDIMVMHHDPALGLGNPYKLADMSDGEKAIFYMIGQTLVADEGSVFIMDEPEIHVHRSILGRLWDELEAARPDCAFLLITHDLEFAASRSGKKYVVVSYSAPGSWNIEDVPEAEGFKEDLITLILGSRKPILFVEGEGGSLDLALYRACYPDWTVVPRGSCENVIHSVVTMRNNSTLTRITCAGLIDADSNSVDDREYLSKKGVEILPVSEIENLLLLPSVSAAILRLNDLGDAEIALELASLKAAIFADVSNQANLDEVVLRHCSRRIDRSLKKLDLSKSTSVTELVASYTARTAELNIDEIANEIRNNIQAAVAADDLAALLAIYDRKKPLLALAASHLRNWKVDKFSAWVTRSIRSTRDDTLREAVRSVLPSLTPG